MNEFSIVITTTFAFIIPTKEVCSLFNKKQTKREEHYHRWAVFVQRGNLSLQIMCSVVCFRVVKDDGWKKKPVEAERWDSGIFVVNHREEITTVHLIIEALLIIRLHIGCLCIGRGGLSSTLPPSLPPCFSHSLFSFSLWRKNILIPAPVGKTDLIPLLN